MRVMLVSHTGHFGGAERSLLALACGLNASGKSEALLAVPSAGELYARARACGIECDPLVPVPFEGIRRGLRWLRLPLAFTRSVLSLSAALRRRKIGLLHANGAKAFLIALVAARLARIPCVWHVRDYPRRGALTGWMLQKAALTLVPSHFIATALRQNAHMGHASVMVVPNGIEAPARVADGRAEMRESLGLDTGALVFIMVAQLAPWKRHDLFLEAARRVAEGVPEAVFVVVGSDLWGLDKEYEVQLRRAAASPGLEGRVLFLGQRDDVAALLQAADVLVLPSRGEPFGRVVVEAWHAQIPVIVSDGGGPAELVECGVTGLHFADGDADGLAAAMIALAKDRALCRALGVAGSSKAAEYGVERHVAAVENAYMGLVA